MPRSTRVLLILGAAACGIALIIHVLALPSVGGRLGLFRAYDALPRGLVADLATGYAATADRYEQLAASPPEPGAPPEEMRALAKAERGRARRARIELVVREVGRGSFWGGLGLFLLGGLSFVRNVRRQARGEQKPAPEPEPTPEPELTPEPNTDSEATREAVDPEPTPEPDTDAEATHEAVDPEPEPEPDTDAEATRGAVDTEAAAEPDTDAPEPNEDDAGDDR